MRIHTYGTDRANEVNKIFILYGKANKVILIFGPYRKIQTANRPIIAREITLPYNNFKKIDFVKKKTLDEIPQMAKTTK